MLVLSRKPGESVFIGKDISVVVVELKGNRVRIGIDAPEGVHIVREEISKLPAGPISRRTHNHKELQHAAGNP